MSNFGFNPSEFKRLLNQTGCFIAGGAASYILCGEDPATFDGDIDVWYPLAPPRDSFDGEPSTKVDLLRVNAYHYSRGLIEKYMQEHGYQNAGFDKDFTMEYTNKENPLSKEILCVLCYQFMNRKVQFIFAFGNPDTILNSFDYSFCAVGYGADNKFFGKDLELTKEKKGYPMNPARTPGRDAMRREKYEKRGYKIQIWKQA